MTANLHNMQHDEDPKQLILEKIGNIDDIKLFGQQILVVTYIRPEKMKSGLFITSAVRDEDKFQGKCGLVVKKGPLADEEIKKLNNGQSEVKLHDWLFYRPTDGYAMSVNGTHCRVLYAEDTRGTIPAPDIIL